MYGSQQEPAATGSSLIILELAFRFTFWLDDRWQRQRSSCCSLRHHHHRHGHRSSRRFFNNPTSQLSLLGGLARGCIVHPSMRCVVAGGTHFLFAAICDSRAGKHGDHVLNFHRFRVVPTRFDRKFYFLPPRVPVLYCEAIRYRKLFRLQTILPAWIICFMAS